MHKVLKKSDLKECFIIRYADDLKILCRTRSQAIRMNYAVKDFLKTRLHLETSEEKSKVVNLKKNSSEFLGFAIRAVRKGKTKMGFVAQSNMTKKAKSNAFIKIKEAVKTIQKKPCIATVWHYNTVVMGIQNYYAAATQITLQKRYKGYEPKYYKIRSMVFVPIYAQRHKTNLGFSQETCNYTVKGREKIHKNLK